MTDFAVLPDDHIETPVLRKYAPGAFCGVVAAYKGATMRYLLDHGAKYVVGVEPQEWAYNEAVASLAPLKYEGRYYVDNVALVPWHTEPDSLVAMYGEDNDAASLLPIHPYKQDVRAMNVREWILATLHGRLRKAFDLLVVNCEGSEYSLLPYMAPWADVILVQFHGPPIPAEQLGLARRLTTIGKGWCLIQ